MRDPLFDLYLAAVEYLRRKEDAEYYEALGLPSAVATAKREQEAALAKFPALVENVRAMLRRSVKIR